MNLNYFVFETDRLSFNNNFSLDDKLIKFHDGEVSLNTDYQMDYHYLLAKCKMIQYFKIKSSIWRRKLFVVNKIRLQ